MNESELNTCAHAYTHTHKHRERERERNRKRDREREKKFERRVLGHGSTEEGAMYLQVSVSKLCLSKHGGFFPQEVYRGLS